MTLSPRLRQGQQHGLMFVVVFNVLLVLLMMMPLARAFMVPKNHQRQSHALHTSAFSVVGSSLRQRRASGALHLFGRGGGQQSDGDNEEKGSTKKDSDEEKNKKGLMGKVLPTSWFGGREENDSDTETTTTAAAVATPAPAPPPPSEAAQQAAKLLAEAERARLEADRLDAELTLQKISRLEQEIAHQQAVMARAAQAESSSSESTTTTTTRTSSSTKSQERVDELQREMQALQAKMRGEAPKPAQPAAATETKKSSSSAAATLDRLVAGSPSASSTVSSTSATSTKPAVAAGSGFAGELSSLVEPFDETKFQETSKYVADAPTFLLKTLALQVEYNDFETVSDINVTEVSRRFDQMNRLDFSYSSRPAPVFSQRQIDKRAAELSESSGKWLDETAVLHPRIQEVGKDNVTKLALLALEYEYYMEESDNMSMDQLEKIVQDEEWLQPMLTALNKSAVDNTIETLYPKCTRKEREDPNMGGSIVAAPSFMVPTMAQVQQLVSTVLPAAGFTCRSKPQAVAGGFILRGTVKGSGTAEKGNTGDVFIDKLDAELAKSSLGDKMTVLYTNDFTIFADDEAMDNPLMDPATQDPIIYVMGPDICREPRPFQLSLVTALGLATSWYLSIYPFLLNPTIAARVDEQLALVDTNMTPDLSWLTELAVPLFTTFVGIQLLHEMGHLTVAGFHKLKTSVPTFVPSIITGVTSTVTTFKEPPKNKQQMFDFSLAGPLTGMLASIAAIALGSQLTVLFAEQQPSLLPALPLEILRQSTLGGGIINAILGNGALSVPEGALGSQAVSGMTIPLHPVAIAGYISLVVNALSMLPIGTTDGGRIGLTLFGRGAKLLVANIFLFAVLIVGVLGSDLFLFYFGFCIAFQTGNEIPSRNEVDSLDFPRVALATAAYVLALLALVPFQ